MQHVEKNKKNKETKTNHTKSKRFQGLISASMKVNIVGTWLVVATFFQRKTRPVSGEKTVQVVEIQMVFPPKTNGWKLKINENDLFEQETCSSNTMMFTGQITILS